MNALGFFRRPNLVAYAIHRLPAAWQEPAIRHVCVLVRFCRDTSRWLIARRVNSLANSERALGACFALVREQAGEIAGMGAPLSTPRSLKRNPVSAPTLRGLRYWVRSRIVARSRYRSAASKAVRLGCGHICAAGKRIEDLRRITGGFSTATA